MQTTEPTPIATTAVMNLLLLRRLDKMARRLATLDLLAAFHSLQARHRHSLQCFSSAQNFAQPATLASLRCDQPEAHAAPASVGW